MTSGTEVLWVGHAIAGIFSFVFVVTGVIAGAGITERIKRIRETYTYKLHRKINTYATLLIVGTFVYGLWSRIAHGEPLFWQHVESFAVVLHGWWGLIVSIVAVFQIVSCFAVKDRRKTRRLHMVLGYSLVILLVVQTVLGIESSIV